MKKNQRIQPHPQLNNMEQEQVFYSWLPEDVFKFNSSEFSTIYNTLEELVNTPTFQEDLMRANTTIKTANLYNLMTEKMKNLVAAGVVKKINKEERDELFRLEQLKQSIKNDTPGKAIMETKN